MIRKQTRNGRQIKVYKAERIPFLYIESQIKFLNKEYGVVFTDSPEEADICMAQRTKTLATIIEKYGEEKQYLIFTPEPRWNKCFEDHTFINDIKVPLMNCYSKDVWLNNHLIFKADLWSENANPIENQHDFSRPKKKKIVALVTYRNNQKRWSLQKDGQEIDLSYLRTQIALRGHQLGKIDVYGQHWPDGIALEDTRYASDWRVQKREILQDYSFNLAMENTNVDYYCTEKIWDSIVCGCLPIYYGKGNKIYEDFPRDSFLDYADFVNPEALFEYIEKMPFSEFRERMHRCFQVCDRLAKMYPNNDSQLTRLVHNVGQKFRQLKRELDYRNSLFRKILMRITERS